MCSRLVLAAIDLQDRSVRLSVDEGIVDFQLATRLYRDARHGGCSNDVVSSGGFLRSMMLD